MKLFHPLLLFLLSLHSSRTSASCYLPNGNDVNIFSASDVYTPCSPGDDVSMCCAQNRNLPDKCRSDGLCLSTWDTNIWRDSCTDRTWKSPKCIKLCTQGIGFYIEGTDPRNLSSEHTTVTPCPDGSYCCGNGTIGQSCCNERKGVFLLGGDTIASSNIPSSATSSRSSSAATVLSVPKSSSASATSASSSSSDITLTHATSSSPSASWKTTGIIVGAVLGAALILTIGFAIFLLKKSQRKRPPPKPLPTDQILAPQFFRHRAELYGVDGRKELDGRGYHAEMYGDDGRKELVGRGHQAELDGVGI